MDATITIEQKDIDAAIKEYIERHGWTVRGTVSLSYVAGDGREPSSYSATVRVQPRRVDSEGRDR